MPPTSLDLRYGMNPHQRPARASADGGLPFVVRNGRPGFVNLLDALNSWQLVTELRAATGLPAAASFKHVSPAGAAVATPIGDDLAAAYMVDRALTPVATAYVRARGADRVSSFGDWAALSDPVDETTAQILSREVSDGVVAPSFAPEALAILAKKKQGAYCVIEMDPAYAPPETETREVFGVRMEQRRNDARIDASLLANIATRRTEMSADARRDALVAMIALKYTQSNTIVLARDGQTIGIGAGQQSRIHCTRLACGKADVWWLRQHPRTRDLPFRKGLSRPERDNAIDGFVREDLTPTELRAWRDAFTEAPERLTAEERAAWLSRLTGVTLASDAYIPFRDNVDRAAASGVTTIVQTGGSKNDESVISAANEHGMVMAMSGLRLFHH